MKPEKHQRNRADRNKRLREGAVQVTHGELNTYIEWGCRCDECTAARAADERRKYADRKTRTDYDDLREQRNRELRQERHQAQAQTLERAWRRGQPWTGPELELVLREDLTIKQVALMIGRTWSAVRWARKMAQTDPRKIDLAGLGERSDES